MFQLRKYLIALIPLLMVLTSLTVKADDSVFTNVAVNSYDVAYHYSGKRPLRYYKWVDEEGYIIYSDQPSPGAEEIKVDKIQTLQIPEVKQPEPEITDKPIRVEYKKLTIISPKDNEGIRDNAGNVTIFVSMEPALDTDADDHLILHMDGKKEAESNEMQFSLNNVDRGNHQFIVALEDKDGMELKRSTPITVTIQRRSAILQPAPLHSKHHHRERSNNRITHH